MPILLKKGLISFYVFGLNMTVKVAKKMHFFFFFWAKYDSCDVYLKNGLIQNRLCERRF
jgi:hypothetical protein